MSLEQGTCYISSNENSLKVGINPGGTFCLQAGEEAPDPLNIFFSSAASAFGRKTVGLLLTGLGKDGADGLARIQQESGVTIVEDSRCCVHPYLVDQAIGSGVVDHVLDEKDIPRAIESLMVPA
jgi:two-component system chemotaxis response regulator CheB